MLFRSVSRRAQLVRLLLAQPLDLLEDGLASRLAKLLEETGALGAHRMALGTLQQDTGRQVEALEAEMWRMERGTELLKKRLEWFEKDKKG